MRAAKTAFDTHWEPMKPTDRGKILVRLAELIEREATRLGEIEVKIMENFLLKWVRKQSILQSGIGILGV